jgi:hypothetical protein
METNGLGPCRAEEQGIFIPCFVQKVRDRRNENGEPRRPADLS